MSLLPRLQQLEKKVYVHHGEIPSEFSQLKEEVNSFKDKLEVCIIHFILPLLFIAV